MPHHTEQHVGDLAMLVLALCSIMGLAAAVATGQSISAMLLVFTLLHVMPSVCLPTLLHWVLCMYVSPNRSTWYRTVRGGGNSGRNQRSTPCSMQAWLPLLSPGLRCTPAGTVWGGAGAVNAAWRTCIQHVRDS